MITGYKKLTGRYLKAGKKRAVLTIIGVMLSVALISTIGLFFYSMQLAEIQAQKDSNGSYHLLFKNASKDLISNITNNPKVSRSGFYNITDRTKIDNSISVEVITGTDKALELLPSKLKAGRMPEKENEAAIEKWALDYIDKDAKPGSNIYINNKEYKLVGILQDSSKNQFEKKTFVLTKNNNIPIKNSTLLVEISSKTRLMSTVNRLKSLVPKGDVIENSNLLSVEGATNSSGFKGLFMTLGVIIAIVVVSTIAVIYNSFQISVVERIKQFGLLRAVGATPKQIRRIVLGEATFIAAIAVPLGLLLGIGAIYSIGFVFSIIGGESVFAMKTTISPIIMIISAVVGLISVYISALIPALFAGRISPLVAISSRLSITKEKIKKRKNRITERMIHKMFGFEGSLASKNIKRNKKRYRITVFSIVISVVLFVTFKSFMDMTLSIGNSLNESQNMNFTVISDGTKIDGTNTGSIEDNTIESLKKLIDIDKIYRVYESYAFETEIDKTMELKKIQDMGKIYDDKNLNNDKRSLVKAAIEPYDDSSLEIAKKYLQSGSIDKDKLNEENGVILINKNIVYNNKTNVKYVGPLANVKVGDEINIQFNSAGWQSKSEPKFGGSAVKKVKVLAILNREPFNYMGPQEAFKFISTKEVCENLTGKNNIKPIELNMTIKNLKNEETVKDNIENILHSNPSLRLINDLDQNRNDKAIMLMIEILIYGFVIVVSLIGSVNIINTMTTNIILRRQEFAALKSIGLTQRGLSKIIIIEGMLYGIIGAAYGSAVGCGLSYLMYRGLGRMREFNWAVPWSAIIIAGISALAIGYISVLAPLSRIKKENLIEAIREDY